MGEGLGRRAGRCTRHLMVAVALAIACGACHRGGDSPAVGGPATKTDFPGEVTAGSATSGALMAQSKQSTASMPSGTPGIPQGAGGNTSGTGMGGATPGSGAAGTGASSATAAQGGGTTTADKPATAAPPTKEEAAAKAKAQAEKEKQELAQAMDDAAARWKSNASKNGWRVASVARVEQVGDIGKGETIRSEKLGTAPASADAKDPRMQKAPAPVRR